MSPNATDWFIRSVLIAVRKLDRSVEFYQDVMGLDVLSRDGGVAILGQKGAATSASCALILRETPNHAIRHGQQELGTRVVCFNLETQAALDHVEERLASYGQLGTRRPLSDNEPLDIVRGHDPDGLPIVFLSYEGHEWLQEDHYRNVAINMYGLDV